MQIPEEQTEEIDTQKKQSNAGIILYRIALLGILGFIAFKLHELESTTQSVYISDISSYASLKTKPVVIQNPSDKQTNSMEVVITGVQMKSWESIPVSVSNTVPVEVGNTVDVNMDNAVDVNITDTVNVTAPYGIDINSSLTGLPVNVTNFYELR
jgi:hypothetical protein